MLNASAARRGPRLRADDAELAQLRDDHRVVGRIRDRGHAGGIARRGAEQGGAGDVDHLDRLVEPDELDPDGRRERLDVDDDDVDEPDALRLELLELGGDVAPGEDARVDRVMEGLDLAADVRLALGQRRDRCRPPRPGRQGTRACRRSRRRRSRSRGDLAQDRRSRLGSPLTAGLAPGAFLPIPWLETCQRGAPTGLRDGRDAPHRSGRVYRLTWHTPGPIQT